MLFSVTGFLNLFIVPEKFLDAQLHLHTHLHTDTKAYTHTHASRDTFIDIHLPLHLWIHIFTHTYTLTYGGKLSCIYVACPYPARSTVGLNTNLLPSGVSARGTRGTKSIFTIHSCCCSSPASVTGPRESLLRDPPREGCHMWFW